MDEAIRAAAADMGYRSRSELIRDALRAFLKEKACLDEHQGAIEGVITLLYEHDAAAVVSTVRHQHMHIFRSFMHSDFDATACSCCEVLMFSGDVVAVSTAYYQLKAIKGVEEAHIYVASR
jgi:metal-responsive CopG/Arc/MetJ family transcriptional regulator